MNRLLAIDYGTKRVGLAVSDPLQIIATGLATVAPEDLMDFLKGYLAQEPVSTFVVGYPLHLDGNPAQIAPQIDQLITDLRKHFPTVEVVKEDERFTSEDAKKIIRASGAKKKKRRDKRLVDKIAAVLILQAFMERTCY